MGIAKVQIRDTCVNMQNMVSYEVLRKSPLLAHAEKSTLCEMVSKMHYERMPKGYLFDNQMQIHKYFYILAKGRIKVSRYHDNDGRELTLFLSGVGEGFNVLNLIDDDPLDDDLRISAVEDIEVLYAPITQWIDWFGKYPVIYKTAHRAALKQIGRIRGLASELAFDNTKTRLIHLLLRYFETSTNGFRLIDDLSQEELANMIGSVRPVVARLLSQLRREGAIDRCGGRLQVTNYGKLKSLAAKNQASL